MKRVNAVRYISVIPPHWALLSHRLDRVDDAARPMLLMKLYAVTDLILASAMWFTEVEITFSLQMFFLDKMSFISISQQIMRLFITFIQIQHCSGALLIQKLQSQSLCFIVVRHSQNNSRNQFYCNTTFALSTKLIIIWSCTRHLYILLTPKRAVRCSLVCRDVDALDNSAPGLTFKSIVCDGAVCRIHI